jgi:predicted phosphohydrolase
VRIVAVADTHLFHDRLAVPDGDVFIHAGDMCRRGDLLELRAAASWIASLPHRHKVIVAGNHDWAFAREPHAARAMFRGAHYLEDAEVAIDGVRFYGSPWQPEFCSWAFNLPRGRELAEVWSRIPPGIDVLITHGPPDGIGDRMMATRRAGCSDLRRRVAELAPRLHLFGHIHEDGGAWCDGPTTFANVTTWECDRPATVFDLEAGVVTPVVVPPDGRRGAW